MVVFTAAGPAAMPMGPVPAALLTMTDAEPPARWVFSAFSLKPQVPRSATPMSPASAGITGLAGPGLAVPVPTVLQAMLVLLPTAVFGPAKPSGAVSGDVNGTPNEPATIG